MGTRSRTPGTEFIFRLAIPSGGFSAGACVSESEAAHEESAFAAGCDCLTLALEPSEAALLRLNSGYEAR